MAAMFSFPIRLAANGSLVKVEQDTDDGLAEQITIICLTARGERDLVPGFGITDPLFTHAFDEAEVNVNLALFGYPCRVTTPIVEFIDEHTERLRLPFVR